MAVPRIEWQCPRCDRRFAIRADIETPDLCPQCHAAGPAESRASAGSSAPDTPGHLDAYDSGIPPLTDFVPDQPTPDALPTPEIQTASGPLRKYPALKILSIVYKVFAALIAVGGLVTLVIAFVAAVTAEDTSLLYASILFQLGGFVGSVFIAVTLYAFGELIQLFIDIEANTRRQ